MDSFICFLLVLNPLYISYQIKTPFQRNSVLLTGHHAAPVVTLFFKHQYYRTPCHASGHLVTTSATGLRERFLLSGVFYLTLLPAFFKASLGAGSSTSKLTGLHADLQNIALAQLFV